MASVFDVGIFKDTLLPSLALHSTVDAIAYAVGVQTNRVDVKDVAWPASLVLNAWYSAVGRHLLNGESLSSTLHTLSRPEWLLLAGVTVWGSRLVGRIAQRAVGRGEDDPRYADMKKEPGFWTGAALKVFAVEALVQSIVALPFTAPFRHKGAGLVGYHPYVQAIAVGIFTAGFTLEVMADLQLQKHKNEGRTSLLTDGVWSIVRHPNYFGDFLVHVSYPVLLFSSDLLRPLELLSPITNYFYLRYVGGEKQLEQSEIARYAVENIEKGTQLEQQIIEKNAFWPAPKEFSNPWALAVIGCGVLGAVIERGIWTYLGLYD